MATGATTPPACWQPPVNSNRRKKYGRDDGRSLLIKDLILLYSIYVYDKRKLLLLLLLLPRGL
jgi:hypothetical protein